MVWTRQRISTLLLAIFMQAGLFMLSSFGSCLADDGKASAKPRLVVLLVCDQMAYDYLERFHDKFGPSGFRYLEGHGASFRSCRYEQAATQTACGHSIISTGAYPWSTGIVANEWFDRRRGKPVDSCFEEGLELVGANGEAAGTHNLLGTTIGDEMRLATNGRSKIVAISLKSNAALFLGGKLATEVFWFDKKNGSFVSSSQFGHELPAWAKGFNDGRYADRYFGQTWSRLLPEAQYTASTRDDYPWENPMAGDGRQFPHVITGGAQGPSEPYYQAFAATPFANQMTVDFAKQAIDQERLGLHTDPDLLAISFSSQDYLGHAFGPYSQEMEDLVLRLDQNLADLFQNLDQKVGLDKCLIVLSADHGVCPIPEFLKERGMDAGRIDPKSFQSLVNQALSARLGNDDWVQSFLPPNLYLNLDAIDRKKKFQLDVEALTAKIAHSLPGIAEVYTAAQFYANQLPIGPHADAVKKGYYWGRSGEVVVLTKPGYIFSSEQAGTSHGSPYTYDSQVPLIICGPGVQQGIFGRATSPADIAPTIASLLGIEEPSLAEGRVLSEVMAQSASASENQTASSVK